MSGYRGRGRGGPYGGPPRGGRRNAFKWTRGGHDNNNERKVENIPRLLDDDEDMRNEAASAAASRYTPYGPKPTRNQRGNSRAAMDRVGEASIRDRLGAGVASNSIASDEWFKVLIPYGKKNDKKFLIESLTNSAGPFEFDNFHYENNAAVFLVNGRQAASALRGASNRIPTPSGFKLKIITSPSPVKPPSTRGPVGKGSQGSRAGGPELQPDIVEKLKVCLDRRYDFATKSLNLGSLYHDEAMSKEGIYLSLGRREVASNVLSIIKQNIAHLENLDLSNNRIMTLENLSSLVDNAPYIQRLNLRNNVLKSLDELERLQTLKLEELWLENNPLCDKYSNGDTYISAVRKLFPRLKRLDGHDLPNVITFEVDSLSNLPPIKGSFFANDQVHQLLVQFLNQYFTLYDADNREKLLEAYHDNAIFSINFAYNQVISGRQDKFDDYISDSRNLLRIREQSKKLSSLKTGRVTVVSLLAKLPQTIHDPNAFIVDVVHVSPVALIFTVYGIFKERIGVKETNRMRSFTRTFITVPRGDGIVIANETFHVTNASPEQQELAFKTLPAAPTPSTSPAPSTSVSVEIQSEMVKQFALQSTMNEEWSHKCLEQNNWDYNKAAACFTDLQAKGSIPPEAFIK